MNTSQLVKNVFSLLQQLDTQEVIICAGARNMPLVEALKYENFSVKSYFEERSAGFYALGRVKATQKPVAIIVTSGTAVAELLPATIEAWYQQLPLILITADRPKSYRGTGAPQTMNQNNLFDSYVVAAFDWDVFSKFDKFSLSKTGPVHLNVCLDEPLKIDQQVYTHCQPLVQVDFVENSQSKNYHYQFENSLSVIQRKNVIAIIGELSIEERKFVKEILIQKNIVHYCEALSGLQNDPDLMRNQIRSSENEIIEQISQNKVLSVLRIGGVPTLRFWRDLEKKYDFIQVDHFTSRPFPGLARPSKLHHIDDLTRLDLGDSVVMDLSLDQKKYLKKIEIISSYKSSEQFFYSYLLNSVIRKSVYVGNSLPIRVWDLVYNRWQSELNIFAHRGVNGIDGQISGYLGWAKDIPESWCIIGDLTALYDLAALGLASDNQNKLRIVIMNNSGGQIFQRILGPSVYLNAQDVNFSGFAKLWGWSYQKVASESDLLTLFDVTDKKMIIEMVPQEIETQKVWEKLDQLWKNP